jgi:hypothetical protein
VALAVATLALVFAPALAAAPGVPIEPRDVAAAVLAPSTDAGAAITPTRPREVDDGDVLLVALLVVLGLAAVVAARRPAARGVARPHLVVAHLPLSRRGPPAIAA